MAINEATALAEFSPAQAIDALQKLCHDLLASATGAPPRFFDTAELPATTGLRLSALTDWARALTQAARTAEHPFNAGLMLEALSTQAAQMMRGTSSTSTGQRP